MGQQPAAELSSSVSCRMTLDRLSVAFFDPGIPAGHSLVRLINLKFVTDDETAGIFRRLSSTPEFSGIML